MSTSGRWKLYTAGCWLRWRWRPAAAAAAAAPSAAARAAPPAAVPAAGTGRARAARQHPARRHELDQLPARPGRHAGADPQRAARHAPRAATPSTSRPTTSSPTSRCPASPALPASRQGDRMLAAGYVYNKSSYAYGEVISATSSNSGFYMAEELITAIYHRFVMFEPKFREIGTGAATTAAGYTYFTDQFRHHQRLWPRHGQPQPGQLAVQRADQASPPTSSAITKRRIRCPT